MADEDDPKVEGSEGDSAYSEGFGQKKEPEEEEDDDPHDKAGYEEEYKPPKVFQKEYEYTPKEGLKKVEPEAEKGPERTVNIYQHTWGKKPIEGNLVEAKVKTEGKYGDAEAEVGLGHYNVSATSGISIDVDKKELNLTAIDAKLEASVVHGEAEGKFKLGKWVKSLFGSDEPPAAAPPGIPGMPGIPALMAARVGDPTTHGSPLSPGIGSTNVIIGNMPAWRTTLDFHACPIVKGVVPDVGGVVLMGSPTVFINNMMACRIMDFVVEMPGGPNPIAMGCPTVFIGGGGGGGGGAAGAAEKKDDNELTVQGKAEGDLDSVEAELSAGVTVNKEQVMVGVKGSAMAAVAKGSIEGGITIPIPWTSHSITLGASAEGYAGAAGVEGHAEAGWNAKKGFKASFGAAGSLGLGGGLNFTLGFK